ncbi:GPP34 family phosphoprotein [Arthrobacter sp. ISL-69]|uniref:GOLPH3/VPS74 family protein n=1 Tax=Arthrobacter sp. ISL-69 TaxID=2819113 RepID=UPI001BEC66FA|nr:GPP34 family phosphoprotein [Arthrobacter sp. ISL-69]MBT2534806.1 GPP34 family phosphoprotein [Arthrobacter sp. ISL-69]
MNAAIPKAEDLSLPQAFLLLATNDKDGEPELPAYVLRTTVAGAILAELDLLGAIAARGKHVRAIGAAPESDFQHELELIREKSRPHTPKRWVSMLEGRGEVHRVYEGMASLGIVEHVGEKHLGLFKSTRYPEKDHAPEAALLQTIQTALGLRPSGATPAAATPPDARTTALIALLQAAGLLARLFPEADQNRARELVKNHWPSRAVEDELRLIRLGLADAA